MATVKIGENGTVTWLLDGQKHNDDGPAEIRADGETRYYCHGQFHRLEGPAIVMANGDEFWFKHGLHHRVGGPAVMRKSGFQAWYRNGTYYRPAENGEPMPVIVDKEAISYEGKIFIKITSAEYEKYSYKKPTGSFTKAAPRAKFEDLE